MYYNLLKTCCAERLNMSKSKVLFYEVRLEDLYPKSIYENYELVSTSQKSTPWITAYLIPVNENVDKSIVYHVTSKHFRSIKTMFRWFNKHGVTHGSFTKFVKTPKKRKILTYSFGLRS